MCMEIVVQKTLASFHLISVIDFGVRFGVRFRCPGFVFGGFRVCAHGRWSSGLQASNSKSSSSLRRFLCATLPALCPANWSSSTATWPIPNSGWDRTRGTGRASNGSAMSQMLFQECGNYGPGFQASSDGLQPTSLKECH